MKQVSALLLIIGVALLLCVFAIPYLISDCLYVDIDSGNIRIVTHVGPFQLREPIMVSTIFGSTLFQNMRTSLTGSNNWQLAIEYRGVSMRSTHTQAGNILYALRMLEDVFPIIDRDKAGHIKEDFLTQVAHNQSFDPIAYARQTSAEIIQKK